VAVVRAADFTPHAFVKGPSAQAPRGGACQRPAGV
jgi:hypothetical protein